MGVPRGCPEEDSAELMPRLEDSIQSSLTMSPRVTKKATAALSPRIRAGLKSIEQSPAMRKEDTGKSKVESAMESEERKSIVENYRGALSHKFFHSNSLKPTSRDIREFK